MINEKKSTPQSERADEDSKPITTPNQVPEANSAKRDEDFPGYPHYPAQEDITNPANDTRKVDVDVENINRSTHSVRQQKASEKLQPNLQGDVSPFGTPMNEDDDLGIVE